jgi:hypothetical protein
MGLVGKRLEGQMQVSLDRLGVPLRVEWTPDPNMPIHGEIKGSRLCIYDVEPDETWATFLHEVIEFKLNAFTRVYRTMINSLIEGYEKLAYQEKEGFIEFIPHLMKTQKKSNQIPIKQFKQTD